LVDVNVSVILLINWGGHFFLGLCRDGGEHCNNN